MCATHVGIGTKAHATNTYEQAPQPGKTRLWFTRSLTRTTLTTTPTIRCQHDDDDDNETRRPYSLRSTPFCSPVNNRIPTFRCYLPSPHLKDFLSYLNLGYEPPSHADRQVYTEDDKGYRGSDNGSVEGNRFYLHPSTSGAVNNYIALTCHRIGGS